MKRLLCTSLLIVFCFGLIPAKAFDSAENLDKTVAYALERYADPSYGDEWIVFGLARSGRNVPDSYYDLYMQNAPGDFLNEREQTRIVATDYARLALTLAAIGQTPESFCGENILTYLADMSFLEESNLSGFVYALLAFDSKHYEIPKIDSAQCADREKLLEAILSYEVSGGGFSLLRDGAFDVDITAMAVTALAPYQKDPKVSGVIDRAKVKLSEAQLTTGGFASYDAETSESAAQVIVMLSALGIDAVTDDAFLSNGNSAMDALLSFQKENGAFSHKAGGNANTIATSQALYAMCAYERFTQSRNTLYDLTDVSRDVSLSEDVYISDAYISGNGVYIQANAEQNCQKIMIASLSKDGRIIEILTKTIQLTADMQTFYLQSSYIENADTVKVFVFDDLSNLKPSADVSKLSRK